MPAAFAPRSIPCRAGIALKPEHAHEIPAGSDFQGWFEVRADAYMSADGGEHRFLASLRERFPIAIHSVGLSIGSEDRFSREHLSRAAAIVKRYDPGLVSETLAGASQDGQSRNATPPPYTLRTLTRAALQIDDVQVALRQKILIENSSAYVTHSGDEFPEPDFLRALVRRTGCGLLLDIKNVRDSALKRGLDPIAYIDAFPLEHVEEIHLASHQPVAGDPSPASSTSERQGRADIWALYEHAVGRIGPTPTVIQWEDCESDFQTLRSEAARVDALLMRIDAPKKYTA